MKIFTALFFSLFHSAAVQTQQSGSTILILMKDARLLPETVHLFLSCNRKAINMPSMLGAVTHAECGNNSPHSQKCPAAHEEPCCCFINDRDPVRNK